MKEILPTLVAIAYLLVAVDHFRLGHYGWSLAWLSYSIANVGLIMAEKNI
jgi:hypothetical protein